MQQQVVAAATSRFLPEKSAPAVLDIALGVDVSSMGQLPMRRTVRSCLRVCAVSSQRHRSSASV